MAARLHAVWVVVIVVVHLLLFLVESASEPASEVTALTDIWLRVNDASWTTCTLVLHVGVVLAYHLV